MRAPSDEQPPPVTPETGNRKPETKGSLLRILGVGFGLAVIVGNTIGAGILRTPGEIAKYLPSPWIFLTVWVVGGLYALLGSFSMAELGAMMPRSGGYYVFARRAFGEYPAFVIGWTDFLAQVGSTAAVSLVAAEYTQYLMHREPTRTVPIASAYALVLAVLQWRGIKWGSTAQNLSSAAKALALVGLIVAIFVFAPQGARETASLSIPIGLFAAVMIALQFVIYTYDGWYAVIYFGEEVTDPGRDIPRSMFGGVLSVMAIYLLINIALLYALPMSQIAGNGMPVGTVSTIIFGRYGDTVIRSVMVISMLSAINAYHLMASRIPFAMAADGILTKRVAYVNKGGTPTTALAMSVLAAIAFIVFAESFNKVAAIMAFYFTANYAVAYAAVFVLRRREPRSERPYRAWGYPWSTGIALLLGVLFLTGAFYSDITGGLSAGRKWYTLDSVDSILVLAVSYPLYLLFGLGRKIRSS
jgi:basic amino acid/polyamine antiporter, APA family